MRIIKDLKERVSTMFNTDVIGFDIGEGLIKLVEVNLKQGNIQLSDLAITSTPSGAIVDGKLKDINSLVEQIEPLLKNNSFKAEQVVTAISGEEVIIRTIEIPNMDEEELDEVIYWEAQEQIPISVESAILDYEIITQKPDGNYELMLVAVARDLINKYIELFNNLGLQPVAIEIEPTAAARVINYLYSKETICLVDIGTGTTDVSIFSNGELIFTRTIDISGYDITEEIMDSQNLNFVEAEEYKRSHNFFEDSDLNILIRNLLTAIYRSLDYFQVQYKEYDIEKLVLTGGESNLIGLDTHLENEFEVETERLDLLSSIDSTVNHLNQRELADISQLLNVGIGLAMREGEDNG
ncbi:type IV pilus assembly protein PilM [Sporohalobacter salinus]|uniref:type IV pilus assembly protein PilM n=1 Tax=Sporohalobacter salinus TaxID=1494606 RepID=UPI001961DEC7|nr:type IV pilus assembly protein PilM [Sporohalobacter salinus]MBM7622738.1 type IV pilus assembly protein PilM [Sporohalobacter salinus]